MSEAVEAMKKGSADNRIRFCGLASAHFDFADTPRLRQNAPHNPAPLFIKLAFTVQDNFGLTRLGFTEVSMGYTVPFSSMRSLAAVGNVDSVATSDLPTISRDSSFASIQSLADNGHVGVLFVSDFTEFNDCLLLSTVDGLHSTLQSTCLGVNFFPA
jgi:hypothetical protein